MTKKARHHFGAFLFLVILPLILYMPCIQGRVTLSIYCIAATALIITSYYKDLVEQIVEWGKRNNFYLKWGASIYPGIAAVIILFHKDRIFDNTQIGVSYLKACWADTYIGPKIDFNHNDYSIDAITTPYLISIFLWLAVYVAFVSNEHNSNKKNLDENIKHQDEINRELKSTILRAPNPGIFSSYIEHYEFIVALMLKMDSQSTRQEYEACLKKILARICLLTQLYVNKESKDLIYGANIMLYIPTEFEADQVAYLMHNRECYHFKDRGLDFINGVLRLPKSLIFANTVGGQERNVPPITIPILNAKVLAAETNVDQKLVREINLAGAPKALHSMEWIIDDVLKRENYTNLSPLEIDACLKYWNEQAKDVKSVLSLKIPYAWSKPNSTVLDAIGVMNIDCTHEDLLGQEKAFHATYLSLIFPILCQLSPYLRRYYDMYIEDLKLQMSGKQTITDV